DSWRSRNLSSAEREPGSSSSKARKARCLKLKRGAGLLRWFYLRRFQLLEGQIDDSVLCRIGQERRISLDSVSGTAVKQLFVHISAELHASRYPCPEGYFFQAHSAGRVDRQLAKAMRSFLDFFRSKV